MRRVLASHFAQYSTKPGELFYVSALLCVRDVNRPIAYFDIVNAKLSANFKEVVKLVADQEGFEQSAPEINRKIVGPVYFKLLFKITVFFLKELNFKVTNVALDLL